MRRNSHPIFIWEYTEDAEVDCHGSTEKQEIELGLPRRHGKTGKGIVVWMKINYPGLQPGDNEINKSGGFSPQRKLKLNENFYWP